MFFKVSSDTFIGYEYIIGGGWIYGVDWCWSCDGVMGGESKNVGENNVGVVVFYYGS